MTPQPQGTKKLLEEAYVCISQLSSRLTALQNTNQRQADKLDAYESVLKAVNAHNTPESHESVFSSPDLSWQADQLGDTILQHLKKFESEPASPPDAEQSSQL